MRFIGNLLNKFVLFQGSPESYRGGVEDQAHEPPTLHPAGPSRWVSCNFQNLVVVLVLPCGVGILNLAPLKHLRKLISWSFWPLHASFTSVSMFRET